MFKLFVETSGKRARLVPHHSKINVAERNFGEIDRATALNNVDALEDAIRGMLEDKGIEDAELYTITVPDELAPRPHATADAEPEANPDPKDDRKGKVTEGEKKTETPKETPPTETAEVKDKTEKERQATGQ